MRQLLPDWFTMALVGMVVLATIFPCYGQGAELLKLVTVLAIGLLFFLQGARLSRANVIAGLINWKLQLVVFVSTFALFPLLGLALQALMPGMLDTALWAGILFVCVLPSTVQSSIALTSIGRGNVAAAVCAATASNLIGIALTPLLVALVLNTKGAASSSGSEVWKIVVQLLLPFLAGQILRPWIVNWVHRHKALLSYTDRSSILLVVYTAFSEAVIEGLWKSMPLFDLAKLLLVDGILLALVLACTTWGSRLLHFDRADEVTIVFCGSKKSLASGVPMANVLFPIAMIGKIVLPLMLFHQIQLMVCAVIARRYAARDDDDSAMRVASAKA